MIKIEKLNETYIRVISEPGIEKELHEFFKFKVPGYQFMPAYRAKIWSGDIFLYDINRKTLYAGLEPYVYSFAKKQNLSIEGYNKDNYLESEAIQQYISSVVVPDNKQPRDYQIAAITHAMSNKRALLLSPTASGKSLIIYYITRWFLEQDRKTLIIVPTTTLVEQLYSDFKEYNVESDVIDEFALLYSGKDKNFTKNVLITTWQSIYKNSKSWFDQFECIIGDEAHHFKAKSLTSVMEKMSSVPYRIGTTGTIDNKQVHKLVLEGLFGPVYQVTSTKELISKNQLSDLKIKCILLKYDDETRKACKKINYQDEMKFLVQNNKRNKFIVNLACATKGNTLLLFQYVDLHGIPLYEAIKQKVNHRPIHYISGKINTSIREQTRKDVETQEDAIIVASYATFSTGINMPSIENIIFASPTKSKIRNLQSIGRGLRLKEGKSHCNLFDIGDDLSYKSWKNHTLNHLSERIKIYTNEQFNFKLEEVML
jgi:superfamily II DNA or RNA helicase